MKIAVDAMGGDYAPQAIVEGAVLAVREQPNGRQILLVGDERQIQTELKRLQAEQLTAITIVHCSQVVGMDELPVLAIRRKKDSSIMRAATLVKEGRADALITAGNTGAAVAATKIKWRGLPGVERPAIAVVIPSPQGMFVLLDAGATIDCKPRNLVQFAVMGSVYSQYLLEIDNPKVGILSLGTEEIKGTVLTREAYKILQKTQLNFIGNVEGSDLFSEKVDVVVCDGFLGNVALKVCESLAGAFQYIIKEEVMKDTLAKFGALLVKRTLKRIAKKIHYAEYGGAPLLGVNGTCIISHGRSSPQAIKNAIAVTGRMVQQDINKHITETIAGLSGE